jgi:hypothetical protein
MSLKPSVFAGLLLLGFLSGPVVAAGQRVGLTFYVPGRPPTTHLAPWAPGTTVERAMQRAGIHYVTGWSPGPGNALLIAEGIPFLTNGALGVPFWWLCIDGRSPTVGMTNARIPSWRSKVEWFWTTEQTCKPQ